MCVECFLYNWFGWKQFAEKMTHLFLRSWILTFRFPEISLSKGTVSCNEIVVTTKYLQASWSRNTRCDGCRKPSGHPPCFARYVACRFAGRPDALRHCRIEGKLAASLIRGYVIPDSDVSRIWLKNFRQPATIKHARLRCRGRRGVMRLGTVPARTHARAEGH